MLYAVFILHPMVQKHPILPHISSPFFLFPVHSPLMIQASVHDLHHCNTVAMAQQQRTPISECQG